MAQVSVDRAMELALAQQRAGQWRNAEEIYRQILGQFPSHAKAIQRLGVLLAQQGRIGEALPLFQRFVELQPASAEGFSDLGSALRSAGRTEEAIEKLSRAISLNPNLGMAHGNLANVYRELGRMDDAMVEYQRAIQLNPNHAPSHSNYGNALASKNQLSDAMAAFRRAIELDPNFAPAHNNLGVMLERMHRSEEAVAEFHRAIAISPAHSDAHTNLGRSLESLDQMDAALAAHERAVEIDPNNTSALCNLGNVLAGSGKLERAMEVLRRAIAIRPEMPEAHNNLGATLVDLGDSEAAIESYRHALGLNPDYADALSNLAIALINKGELAGTEAMLRRAIALEPDLGVAHWNLAILLLLLGDFEHGLPEYEWRWKVRNVMRGSPKIAQERWDGRELGGRTILLHTEQGFGDAIQFIRYVPMVAQRGARIVLRCPAELKRLFAPLPHIAEIGEAGAPLPKFDEHCPLLSLPLIFRTDLNSIPARVPYLHADENLARVWKEKLAGHAASRKIGLSWSGASIHPNDRNRSTTLATFAPLAEIRDATFISLQKGPAAGQQAPGLQVVDFSRELGDFADTAALIENLDLIVTVDTAVAHLAGALGKAVWVILPSNPDWRWMYGRGDSPWYPTMRLFRRRGPGDWAAVMADVVKSLQ